MVGFESGDTDERGCWTAALCTTTLVLHRVLWYGVVLDITLALSFILPDLIASPWSARSSDISPIENMWSMVAQRLTQITPPAATPDQLWKRVEAAWSTVPQEHIQSLFESMPRRVATVVSNNGGYSGY
ncbi:transposable element Tcb1 transposase [Trichonephila clavipes]|nr:transposable element Tcb1 transposase [Trichonephila clavipes]